MTQTLARPADFFDQQYGMNTTSLQRVLDRTLSPQIDYADLYFQYEVSDAVSLEEGEVKQGSKQINQGVGIRALAGEKTGYAFSDEITVPSLEAAARTAREIAQSASQSASVAVQGAQAPAHDLYAVQVAGTDIPVQRKLDLLQQIDAFCRAYDPRITKVQTSFSSVHKLVLIATSEGKVVGDVQPLLRLNVTCIAEADGNRQNGSAGGGGRVSFETFIKEEQYLDLAREAARRAVLNSGRHRCPGWHDGRGARARLAGYSAARGDRSRAGGRLQSQGYVGVQRPYRRAHRVGGVHGGR